MKKKFNFKLFLIGALVLCVLAVSFLIPSFALPPAEQVFTISYSSLPITHNFSMGEATLYLSDGFPDCTLRLDTSSSISLESYGSIDSSIDLQVANGRFYIAGVDFETYLRFTIYSDPTDLVFSLVSEPTPTPAPDVWDSTSEFTGGFFGGATSIFNALFSSPVFALLVIGLPLAGIIIGFVLKVTFLKKKR